MCFKKKIQDSFLQRQKEVQTSIELYPNNSDEVRQMPPFPQQKRGMRAERRGGGPGTWDPREGRQIK